MGHIQYVYHYGSRDITVLLDRLLITVVYP